MLLPVSGGRQRVVKTGGEQCRRMVWTVESERVEMGSWWAVLSSGHRADLGWRCRLRWLARRWRGRLRGGCRGKGRALQDRTENLSTRLPPDTVNCDVDWRFRCFCCWYSVLRCWCCQYFLYVFLLLSIMFGFWICFCVIVVISVFGHHCCRCCICSCCWWSFGVFFVIVDIHVVIVVVSLIVFWML